MEIIVGIIMTILAALSGFFLGKSKAETTQKEKEMNDAYEKAKDNLKAREEIQSINEKYDDPRDRLMAKIKVLKGDE